MASVSLENVSLTYHSKNSETLALDNINIAINDGEIYGIVGPSGCGKTTILSLVAGLISPSQGKIKINDKQLIAAPKSAFNKMKSIINITNNIDDDHIIYGSHHAGYMLQHDQLFQWRTIFSNVMLGLEIKGIKKDQQAIAYANELLNKYGLENFKKHFPNQLSGGMRQRVALVRTLVQSPEILLLDEPFSALDFQTRLKVCDDVQQIIKSEGKTAIFVTHDISEAISVSDKIIVLSKRPAHVRELLSLDEIKELSPLARRESSHFAAIFEKIWSTL